MYRVYVRIGGGFHPIYYLRHIYSRLFSPLPTTIRALHVVARRLQLFLLSSTSVKMRLFPHYVVGALSSRSFYFCKEIPNPTTAGFELQDQH